MKLYKNFNILKNHQGSIILIGNFDGVHLGHQKLFKLANTYKKKRVLSIGDNLNTDIKGANFLNYDSLLISSGVHKDEIKKEGIDIVSKKYEAIVNFTQTELKW